MNQHYSHADRDSLKPIAWKDDGEKDRFKTFVLETLSEEGPTHLDSLMTKFFETEYLSPVYMGRLSPALVALEELRRSGKVLIEESEYAPIRLPNQLQGKSA